MKTYWDAYAQTLARIVEEKPQTVDELKAILDGFTPPSSGIAFFPGGADETLGEAMHLAGWVIDWREGDYLWVGRSKTGEVLTHVEGDIYRGDATLPNRD
jgi:hypothetical protein